MRLLEKTQDGGPSSGVTCYFLFECKPLCSVVLMHFGRGTSEVFHSHAFNALTLWLKGRVVEFYRDGGARSWHAGQLKYTSRDCFHRVASGGGTWALSLRGPWKDNWQEVRDGRLRTLTHGRKVVGDA